MNPNEGLSRRRFLSLGATASALAAAGTLLPPSLHEAIAAPMPRGGLGAVEHVVVLMQENRAFDHYFGTLRGVRGYGDTHPLRLPGGRPVFAQPSPTGDVLPFAVHDAAARAGRPLTDIEYIGALAHGFGDATAAWRQGWWDGWVPAKTAATMAHYERADIPLQYELAETFTVCDAYHCSVFGSTNPNRNYLWTGTTGFEPGTTDRAVTNAAYSYDHPGYGWTTYPERLEAAGVPWRIYQEWDNFTDNAVEYFAPFKRIGHALLAGVDGHYRTTEELYYAVLDMPATEQRRLLGQLAAARNKLSPADRSLFDRGMARSEPESLVPALRADIAAGTLPAVSWLVPSAVDSEHPGASTPVGSATLIYDVLDALAADPDTWSRTVLFVNFDENDGYFDHVPPPVAPRPASGNGDDWFGGRPIGLGPRVPMTVVSPWTIGGFVSSEVFDHTSTLRFLERWTGVAEPQISAWRRSVCGDLTSAFDFARPGTPPRLAHPGPVPAPISRWRPAPPPVGAQPVQEPGTRPARPVPYRPAVTATLAGATLTLTLADRGPAVAPFAVYPYAGEQPAPSHHAVRGSEAVALPMPAGRYDVTVQGPDGFWAEFAGTVAGVRVAAEPRPAGPGEVGVLLRNDGAAAAAVTVTPGGSAVTLGPGAAKAIRVPAPDGRFDVRVTAAADPAYRRRLTGRAGA